MLNGTLFKTGEEYFFLFLIEKDPYALDARVEVTEMFTKSGEVNYISSYNPTENIQRQDYKTPNSTSIECRGRVFTIR